MTREEIRALLPGERVAGYILVSANLAMVGARLRANGREDKTWTEEEEKEWDNASDAIDPWWYELTEQERAGIKLIEIMMADITNGKWPPAILALV